MNFMDAVKSVYSNYANFQGRARRSEYWWFVLFFIIVAFVLALVETYLTQTMFLYTLFVLGSLIPLIGGIWLLVLYVMDSQPGVNKYSPNPKGIVAGVADAVTGG